MKNNLNFPQLLNVRDLGGYPTRDGRETKWKSVLRADELNRLTAEGAAALMEYGVRTVIDLRFPHEARERPNLAELDASRLNCIHICLCGGDSEAWKTFYHKGGSKDMWNCAILEDSKEPIGAVMRAIAHAPAGGVLFHCVSGKDRTGIIASLLLAIADVEPAAIERDYTISTDNLRDAYIGSKTGEEREAVLHRVHCPAEQIHNMLAHLDKRYSGVTGYFHEIGLTADEASQLKNRLLDTAN
jgi:protein-tyrosine phosphatase